VNSCALCSGNLALTPTIPPSNTAWPARPVPSNWRCPCWPLPNLLTPITPAGLCSGCGPKAGTNRVSRAACT
jgi:hypothetical protein